MGTQNHGISGFRQEIRFAHAKDGARIAYAVSGQGYPLVRGTHWLTNIEFDWQTPTVGQLIRDYSARFRLYRYNPRGYGPSEGAEAALTFDTLVSDLAAVIDAAGLDRVALNGSSGGALAAIGYAARHPKRVSHMVLLGAYARGLLRRNPTPQQRERLYATAKLIELGWGDDNPGVRQLFTTEFFPDATLEQMRSFNELQRRSASPRVAARMFLANQALDVSELLGRVECPTLVLHCRGDVRVPVDEGRLIAAAIPNAKFVPLESANHVPLPGERAYERLFDEIAEFLPRGANQPRPAPLRALTPREQEVLDLIARGRDNAQIAATLGLSDKTVRNHITHIFEKLSVENRGQAIVLAREAGLGR
jgi:pimeloyl-ACP methyl ester carboxylesterase